MNRRNPLAFLGRQGARAVALSLVLGCIPNPLGPLFRTILPETIFILLVVAFLRVDPDRALHHAKRPTLILLITAWVMLVTPLATGYAVGALGVAPGLALALILMAAAPPVMSAPAFAYLLGLDGALSLALLVACMLATPLTAPFMAALSLPEALPLTATALAGRLFLLLAGSAGVAIVLRWLAGKSRIAGARDELDGLNVVMLFVFAVALMDGMPAQIAASPGLVFGLVLLSFGVSLALIGLTMLVSRPLPRGEALALSLGAGTRNMGLMLAALDGRVPELTFMYFALAQVPIYLLPLFLQPLAARLQPPAPS